MLVTFEGKGKELHDLLRRELGVPDRASWFEVRFARDEVVQVKCQYEPENSSVIATVPFAPNMKVEG